MATKNPKIEQYRDMENSSLNKKVEYNGHII